MKEDENVIGYGSGNPFVPPLVKPDWLLNVFDRHIMLTFSFPLVTYFNAVIAFLTGLANGDSWDGYAYNNAAAIGAQLYPMGLNKYYDLFSYVGFINYIGDWIWIWRNCCSFALEGKRTSSKIN